LNTGCFTAQAAQVVQSCPANPASSHNFNTIDLGSVQGECSFHSHPVGNSPDRKGFAEAPAPAPDYHAFKDLDSFPAAFNNLYMNPDGVTRAETDNILFYLFLFERLNEVHLAVPSFPMYVYKAIFKNSSFLHSTNDIIAQTARPGKNFPGK
jgi:hypothetical protein